MNPLLPTDPNQTWPPVPAAWTTIYSDYLLHAAWYSSDMNQLSAVYAGILSAGFWSRAAAKQIAQRQVMVHVPIAKDISRTASRWLFGEAPQYKAADENEQVQAWIDGYVDNANLTRRLSEAANAASGLGGVFLKLDWDKSLSPQPIVTVVQADAALPVFRYNVLQNVLCWQTVKMTDYAVFRLLEYREPGLILSGVYEGTAATIGKRIDLDSLPETAGIQPEVRTGADHLLAWYVPNALPNTKVRGCPLGQSDYAGSESLMESLDEVMTGLQNEILLAKLRILGPEGWFQRMSTGEWVFDLDQQVYQGLLAIESPAAIKDQIVITQPEIRTEQYLDAATKLASDIVTSAGYSPQTFGLQISGQAESGTALRMREIKSYDTTREKAASWRPVIQSLLYWVQVVDRSVMGNKGPKPTPVGVEMQDGVPADPSQTAQTIEMLSRAQALSVETKVELAHPDWTGAKIAAEVERIKAEQGVGVADLEAVFQEPGSGPVE